MGRNIVCPGCERIRVHHAHGLCVSCVNRLPRYRRHIRLFRASSKYKMLRKTYDVKYQLKQAQDEENGDVEKN